MNKADEFQTEDQPKINEVVDLANTETPVKIENQTRKSILENKFIIVILVVLILLSGSFIAWNLLKKGGNDTTQSNQANKEQISDNSRLLICTESLKVIYTPATDEQENTDMCISDEDTGGVYVSPTRQKLLFEIYGPDDSSTLYLADVNNQVEKKAVYQTDRAKFSIIEKVWLEDDEGFIYSLRDETGPKGHIDVPYDMSYFLVEIKEGELSKPRKIYESVGNHASSEGVLGYDKTRKLLIMLDSGPGGCSNIYVINLNTKSRKELENNACDIIVDYENALFYKLDYGYTGELLSHNYLNGQIKTLSKSSNGFYTGMVATEDFKVFYLANNISGKKSGDFLDPKDEKYEILKFTANDGSLEQVRSYSSLQTMVLESLSNTGNFLVFTTQDFSEDGESTASNTNILNLESRSEKKLNIFGGLSDYKLWLR